MELGLLLDEVREKGTLVPELLSLSGPGELTLAQLTFRPTRLLSRVTWRLMEATRSSTQWIRQSSNEPTDMTLLLNLLWVGKLGFEFGLTQKCAWIGSKATLNGRSDETCGHQDKDTSASSVIQFDLMRLINFNAKCFLEVSSKRLAWKGTKWIFLQIFHLYRIRIRVLRFSGEKCAKMGFKL